MPSNIDAAAMRRINKATVLRVVRDLCTTSRIDIAQLTGLNKATVSNIVDELIKEQFVSEIGYGSSSGGRKPVLIQFNANAAYAVGVEIHATYVTTVVSNIGGEIAYHNQVPIVVMSEGQRLEEVILSTLESEITKAIHQVPTSAYGLVGLCVGLPGMVDWETGVVHYLPGLGMGQWDLGAYLSDRFHVRAFCDNNANCGAWSEYVRNSSNASHLVFVQVSGDVSAGIIVNGQIYRGRDGLAGEFGHFTYDPSGPQCECGNTGCWEEYVSERALRRYLNEFGVVQREMKPSASLVQWAVQCAEGNDASVIQSFATLGCHLGLGLANILTALNPELIVLGGTMRQATRYLMPEVKQVIAQRAASQSKETEVLIAAPDAVAVGAAQLAIDAVLFSGGTARGLTRQP